MWAVDDIMTYAEGNQLSVISLAIELLLMAGNQGKNVLLHNKFWSFGYFGTLPTASLLSVTN